MLPINLSILDFKGTRLLYLQQDLYAINLSILDFKESLVKWIDNDGATYKSIHIGF